MSRRAHPGAAGTEDIDNRAGSAKRDGRAVGLASVVTGVLAAWSLLVAVELRAGELGSAGERAPDHQLAPAPDPRLPGLRHRALASLRRDLGASEPYEGAVVARVLGEAGDAEALAFLERALRSPDPLESRSAADALAAVGTEAAVRALRRLHGESPDGQQLALSALRIRRDPQLLPLYGEALESPEPALRISGLEAVAELGAHELRPAVERLRRREVHPVVLTYADYSLARLGDEASLLRLEGRLRHERVEVRDSAAGLLGWLDHPTVAPALRGALDDPALLVRAAAAASLTRFGDASGLESVEESLTHPDLRVRVAAVASLARMHYPTARALIHELLDAPDPIVRAQAYHVVADNRDGALGERATRAARSDPEEFVRVEAIRAMGWIGGSAMVEPLAVMLESPSAPTRHAAAEALLHLASRLETAGSR